MEKKSTEEDFLVKVAAIFEENILHEVTTTKEMERLILKAIDYCLEKEFGDKKNP
jgi:hypothetical protein